MTCFRRRDVAVGLSRTNHWEDSDVEPTLEHRRARRPHTSAPSGSSRSAPARSPSTRRTSWFASGSRSSRRTRSCRVCSDRLVPRWRRLRANRTNPAAATGLGAAWARQGGPGHTGISVSTAMRSSRLLLRQRACVTPVWVSPTSNSRSASSVAAPRQRIRGMVQIRRVLGGSVRSSNLRRVD